MNIIKRVLFYFCILIVLVCFGCNNLIGEKTEKDLEFSIKAPVLRTGITGDETQLLTIKATIEDVDGKVIQKAEKTAFGGEFVTFNFVNIATNLKIKVKIQVFSQDNENPIFVGESDWILTKLGEKKVSIKLEKKEQVIYKVNHYKQNIEDNNYVCSKTTTMIGYAGDLTKATSEQYIGFETKTIEQQIIKEDGSTVVNIYYDRKIVKLTFDLDGGMIETQDTIVLEGKYEAAVVKPENPVKENYTFDGWDKTVPENFPANDETYIAKWIDINQVASVTFNPVSGAVAYNTKITLNCETEDATIWYKLNEGEEVQYSSEIEILITEATTITARAKKEGMKDSAISSASYDLFEYTLIFNTNGGTEVQQQTCYDGTTIQLPGENLTKHGYTFNGWYITSSENIIDELEFSQNMEGLDEETNTVTLNAKWTPDKYSIKYNLNADNDIVENKNPESYTIESNDITLSALERNGYVFMGWYTDEECTESISQIEKGSTGNINLYAKWQKIDSSINVTFPSYNDPEKLITSYDEESQTFTAKEGYFSYEWYVNGVLQKNQNTYMFTLNTENMPGGIYTVMLIVTTKSGEEYSAEDQIEISKKVNGGN